MEPLLVNEGLNSRYAVTNSQSPKMLGVYLSLFLGGQQILLRIYKLSYHSPFKYKTFLEMVKPAWFASSVGIELMRRLPFNSSHMRLWQLSSSGGISPVSRLLPNWRIVRFRRFPTPVEITPLNLLCESENHLSCSQYESESGIVPLIRLLLRINISRFFPPLAQIHSGFLHLYCLPTWSSHKDWAGPRFLEESIHLNYSNLN